MRDPRALKDLSGIGKAMLQDFDRLGIESVAELKKQNPKRLYEKLCRLTGVRQDPCVLDTFVCAVAQAKNPNLPKAQRNWWYWSRVRLANRRAGG